MSNSSIHLPLGQLANGAIQAKLDYQLQKIFDNIHDKNTDAEAKREITIKLVFEPDKNRQTVSVDSSFKMKLADIEGVSTLVITDRDVATGYIEAKELKSKVVGQTYLDENMEQRSDVGEPIDVIEKELNQNKVIDLQAQAKGVK